MASLARERLGILKKTGERIRMSKFDQTCEQYGTDDPSSLKYKQDRQFSGRTWCRPSESRDPHTGNQLQRCEGTGGLNDSCRDYSRGQRWKPTEPRTGLLIPIPTVGQEIGQDGHGRDAV